MNQAKEETKEETKGEIIVEKDLQEGEVVEEVKDQGHNDKTEPEAAVIDTVAVAELKYQTSEDKEAQEDAQEEE